MVSPPLPSALSYLTALHESGLSYSSVNTARSVLSSILAWEDCQTPFGQLPIVKRFMKGIFESRPPLPRYSSTWNVKNVFNYIRSQDDVPLLTLKVLSHRVAFLLALLSGQRCQTISKLSLDNMIIDANKITFIITEKLKHTRPGAHQKPLIYLAYASDKKLCIVTHLQEYFKRTSALRGENKQLLISFIKPHKPISTETTSHWIKNFMSLAGIDTSQYKTHSTRAASTSYLASKHFDLKSIMQAAGWSNEETFQRFYNFDCDTFNFGSAMLDTIS